MRYRSLILLTLFLLASGCSDDKKVEEHVWKEKTDTIQKAKEVEQLIQEAAKQQQQKADEQLQ
jgi:hypothetical protein